MRVLIVLSILGAAIAVPRTPQRIVGGSTTQIEEYPHMVNLEYNWWGDVWQQACGGSLLTTRTVLSAAHCFIGDSPLFWRSRLGSSHRTSGGSVHLVAQLIIHGLYDNFNHDVALAILATPAVYSNSVQSCFIAGPNLVIPDNIPLTAIGWGDLYTGSNQGSTLLQHVEVYSINQAECARRYAILRQDPDFAHWPDVTDGMLCAGIFNQGGRDACQGDSGGPLAYEKNQVVGITSWGYECAHDHYPGVNARVSTYSEWIQSNAV